MNRHCNTLAVSLVLASGVALAHGDEQHAASAPAGHAGAHSHAHGHDDAGVIGKAGDAARVTRAVNVDMTDNMRFNPASISAKQGETIRFVVKNSGQVKHEFVLGTDKELKTHYELMKKFPEMEHSDPNMVTVAPGQTGQVIWQFTKAGKVHFACLQPGHYDAGMKGVVKVAAVGAAQSANANAAGPAASASVAPATAEMTDGEVRKVDKENRKITLRHGEIKNLQMPGMTMVFQVKDPAMLDAVKPGDEVVFTADRANGALVITEIRPARPAQKETR